MINIGLIGFGRYGKKYYRNIINDKDFRLIKILRVSKKKLNNKFTNNSRIFFKNNKINLFIIASPTSSHFEYLQTILKKNKNIIVEKPLVANLKQFIKIKKKLKSSKKIIFINHTDLYSNAYLKLKQNLNLVGKINYAKLVFGKVDNYNIKNITSKYKLPYFEWLPHPLAIINDLFKNTKFKIKVFERRQNINGSIIQNLKIKLKNNDLKIDILFSNNYKNRKRNIEIHGTVGKLIYKGYEREKIFLVNKNKKKHIKTDDVDPVKNILHNFKKNFKNLKIRDDKNLIFSSTKNLFEISDKIRF